jgi:poly(A) polymerase
MGGYEIALGIIRRLKSRGFEAYLAGGCVRDKLLGIKPKDFDIATDATPEVIQKLFRRTLEVGKAFGVIIVLEGSHQFEITTFRSDGEYLDGRHPQGVRFSSWQEDVIRRDFTINGMLYDPVEERLLDIVGGEKDIKHRLIRTIGKPIQRFTEDKLRMLRAVRFGCELGFEIEEETRNAIKRLAGRITEVSYERIREELRLILLSENRAEGVKDLEELGLMEHLLPEICITKGVPQPSEYHPEGDVFTHTVLALSYLKEPSFELALATLLHDVGKPSTFRITDKIRFNAHEKVGEEISRKICRRFRLSRAEEERICWMVEKHMLFKDVEKMRKSTLKRFLSSEYFEELEKLYIADKMASDKDLGALEYIHRKKQEFSQEELRPKPLIGGNDLIALGYKPGPIFKEILTRVYDAQLEGAITTKEDAIEYVKRNF